MTMTANVARIDGKLVMVVEDNYLQADETRQVLARAGARVLGPFGRPADALQRLEAEPALGAVVLDINLGAGLDFALVHQFHARQVPIVLVTGYDKQIVPNDLRGVPYVQKPWDQGQLVSAVARACG